MGYECLDNRGLPKEKTNNCGLSVAVHLNKTGAVFGGGGNCLAKWISNMLVPWFLFIYKIKRKTIGQRLHE